MGKTYTIKSEDKAAFINRLDKLGIAVDTYKITDNKMDGSFSIEFIDPNTINMINQMLKKSPKIDQVKAPKNVYTDKGMKSGGSELKEVENPIDVIKMDVPLFIRLLEYAREDAKTDMDLHDVTEKIIAAASKGQTLTMSDYDMIMSDKIQENFNPDDYEWESDPEFLGLVGGIGDENFVDCKILTTQGEKEIVSFDIDNTHLGEIEPFSDLEWTCSGEDSNGVKYQMNCIITNRGIDGDYITDIDGNTLIVVD
jgi:hypothetical protein